MFNDSIACPRYLFSDFYDGERLLNQLRFGSWLPESTAMGVILLVNTPQENYAYRKRVFQWELTKVGMIFKV
jgi:hypothetical protein